MKSLMTLNWAEDNERKLPNKAIEGFLNINSPSNKFEALQCVIDRNLDIILLSETKLDDSFPSVQFMLRLWYSL